MYILVRCDKMLTVKFGPFFSIDIIPVQRFSTVHYGMLHAAPLHCVLCARL
jgi:hypothetical protein